MVVGATADEGYGGAYRRRRRRRRPNILNTHDIAIQTRVHILLDSLHFV